MKKIFLFMAIFATVLIGALTLTGAVDLSCLTFADFGAMGTITFAVAAPFAKIEDGMNEYLKQIKENKDLTEQEKTFASTIFEKIGTLLKYKEVSDDEKAVKIQEQLDKLNDVKSLAVKEMIDKMQPQIDDLIKQLNDVKASGKAPEKVLNPIDQIVKGFSNLLKEKKGKDKASTELEIKTVIDMGLTTAITGQIPQAMREPGIAYAPEQPLSLLNIIPTGTTTSNKIEWVEKETEEGTPAFKKEFENAPQRSWKSKVYSTDVRKVTVYSEYSKEMVEDVDYFESEVRRDLPYQMQRALETGIYSGDGTDPALKGILEFAQTWDNGTVKLAAGLEANIYDVIGWAHTQINKEHHEADTVLVNNVTARKMRWTKDVNNNYIIPPFVSMGQSIEGMRLIVTELVADNELLVMDSRKAMLYIKKAMTLELFDQHGTNALADILMLKATMRAALKIKNTDAKAFVYCDDISAALTALEVAVS